MLLRRPVLLMTALTCAACALMASIASADSLVYVKGQHAYVANADGSHARAITPSSKWWKWPSESDNGTIAVAGGASRVNPGGASESSGSSEIYAFDQQGRSLLSRPALTPGSTSTPGLPNYVDHFRVSPDGHTVAFDVIGCCGGTGETTFMAALAPGSNWKQYFDDYIDPDWVDGSNIPSVRTPNAIALTHHGPTFGSQAEYAIFDASNGENNYGWHDDTAIPDGYDYQASWTRDVHTLALFLEDSPNYTDFTTRNAQIHLESVTPDGGLVDDCTIALPASQFSTPASNGQASVSFSPDGSILAWGQDDGLYEANVSNPNDCGAIEASKRLVVPGGAMPSFGAAPLSPEAAPNTKIKKVTVARSKHRAVARFSGSGAGPLSFQCKLDHGGWKKCKSPATFRHLKKGSHTLQVRARNGGGADHTPARKKFRA